MRFAFYIFGISLLSIQSGYSLELFSPDTSTSKQSKPTLTDKKLPYSARILQAQELANNKQYGQALDVYNQLIIETPDDLDVLLARGRVYAWNRQYEEAEGDFLAVIQQRPDYGDAWSALGHLYLWWNNPEKAVTTLSTCITLIPDNPELYISLSKAHLSSNELHLARSDLETARRLGGKDDIIDPLTVFIQKKIEKNEAEKAQKLLTEANAKFSQSLFDSALTLYLKIIEHDSTNYSALFKCAQSYSRLGEYENAISLYTRLILADSTDADARLERGRTLTWMKDYKRAERDIKYVTLHYPQYNDARSMLGKLYRWQGMTAKAIDVYMEWIEIASDNPDPYLGLSEVYREARLYPLARESLIKAGKLGVGKKVINKKLRILNRVVSATQWEMRSQYDFQYVGNNRSNWHQLSTGVKREMSRGSLVMNLTKANRFDLWDEALSFEGYIDSWPRSYVYLRFQSAFHPDILPGRDMNLEIFQGFGLGWEFSGSYRFMDFPGNGIHFWGISLAKYEGDWFGYEKTVIFSGLKSQGFTQTFMIRRYLGVVDDFLETRLGFGNTIALVGSGPLIDSRSVIFFTGSYQKFFNSDLGLTGTVSYNAEGQLPVRLGIMIGMIYRW
ncbi:MAG: YaiO family outer membrane beta-barrel protein [Fidelibacterota bacterium]